MNIYIYLYNIHNGKYDSSTIPIIFHMVFVGPRLDHRLGHLAGQVEALRPWLFRVYGG